jgi:peptidoglycan/LPS O-acetylase OafA/YrhL
VHQSFVNYRNYRYGTVAVLATVATIAAYMLDKPRVPPNGGTWLGYTLGTIAGVLVIFLSLFGIRKRAFHSRMGTAIGWLSAHVYLGLAALIIATLHSGLHFGANVHTLAYVLMCIVTLSGCWGMYAYIRYPGLMTRQRGNLRRKELLQQIEELDQRSLGLAKLTRRIEALIVDSIRRTDLDDSSFWSQLRGRDRSYLMIAAGSASQAAHLVPNFDNHALIEQLAEMRLAATDEMTRGTLQGLLECAGAKAALLQRLRRETTLAARLRIWLFIHVPVCCALLVALCTHVLTVFLYW